MNKSYRRRQGKQATYGYFKRGLQSELKYFDYDAGLSANLGTLTGYTTGAEFNGLPMVLTNFPTALDVTTAGMVNANRGIMLINKITQGTDIFARIGREVIMKSLYLRVELASLVNAWFTADPGVVNDSFGTGVRIMVIYDTQTNNVPESSITLEQILKISTSSGGGGAGPIASGYMTAFTNLDYRDRWNIIIDKTYDLGNAYGQQSKTIKIYKKFGKGGLPVTFTGSTGTTINTGALWFIIGGSQADAPSIVAAADQTIAFNYFMSSRIRFTDS